MPSDLDELRRFFEFRDFAHFIEVYLAVVDLIRTPEDIHYLTYEVAREMADRAGAAVRRAHLHAVHLGPSRPAKDRGMPIEAYTEAIEAARVEAERDFGLVLRWIYDIPGEFGVPSADATLDYALDHRPEALVGFGLGGPEVGVPRPQFQPHFERGAGRPGCTACRTPARPPGRRRSGTRCRLLRRRADRARHLGRPGPGAARAPGRDRHPAGGLPVVQHRHPRGRHASRSTRSGRSATPA